MSKASFEIAGIRFTDVDLSVYGISTVKYPSQEEVAAYERGRAAGRAEERADIVAWIREKGGSATRLAEQRADAGNHPESVRFALHSADCFETAAFGIETGVHAKPPAERQDARDGQEGTGAGSDAISSDGGAFP